VPPAVWIVSKSVPTGLSNLRAEFHDGILEIHLWRFALNNGEIAFEYAHVKIPATPQLQKTFAERYHPGLTLHREPLYSPRTGVLGVSDYTRTGFLGFSLTLNSNPTRKIISFFIPIWLFVLIAAIPLLRRLARIWVARERARTTRCPACGYDIRSTPGRCPECGVTPDKVTIAPDIGPAVAAVAKSSGTKCVALMAAYMAAAIFLCFLATPTRRFFRSGQWSHDFFSDIYYILALAILLVGSFHAAGYSRSIEGFFGCGALFSLMLAPLYVYIGRSHSVWVQLLAVILGATLLGSLLCTAATTRWRLQDRPSSRKPASEVTVAPVA